MLWSCSLSIEPPAFGEPPWARRTFGINVSSCGPRDPGVKPLHWVVFLHPRFFVWPVRRGYIGRRRADWLRFISLMGSESITGGYSPSLLSSGSRPSATSILSGSRCCYWDCFVLNADSGFHSCNECSDVLVEGQSWFSIEFRWELFYSWLNPRAQCLSIDSSQLFLVFSWFAHDSSSRLC